MGLAGVGGPNKTQNEIYISTMNPDPENGNLMQFAYADNSELNSYIETNEDPTVHLPDELGGQLSNFVSDHHVISEAHQIDPNASSHHQSNPTL